MAPRKLSDADKRDVIEIYRQPGETTSTIAKRYGVSTSTISRILKTQLPEDEYRALISQKRSAPSGKPVISSQPMVDEKPTPEKPVRRARKRARVAEDNQPDDEGQLELLAAEDSKAAASSDKSLPAETEDISAVATELLENARPRRKDDEDDLDDDLDDDELDDDDLDDDLDDLDGDLDSELDAEFGDEDDEDEDDEDADGESGLVGDVVEIMPISDAVFPRTCYLVVDRLSELITHPLNEFAELGKIPANQESALTLPIFDNHRVARRFSRRNQRVIKVPDGQLITKATTYLQAKGITHLLIDGNIYSLLG